MTPRELVELCLRADRSARIPRLNAFRVTLAEQALAEATTLDGGPLSGPLAGVPIAVKDDIAVRGPGDDARARAPPARRQPADAEPLRRLRAAGAIPIGITNVPELMIFPWTASDANGITRNPWDLGADAGRLLGRLGRRGRGRAGAGGDRLRRRRLDPDPGRVLRARRDEADARSGLAAAARRRLARAATFGALARTVADSALLLDVMHGAVAGDAHSAPPRAAPTSRPRPRRPRPLRIAVSTQGAARD